MRMQSLYYEFDAEDRRVYLAWLRKTLAAYGVFVLFGITATSVLTTPNQREPMQHAIRDFQRPLLSSHNRQSY